MKSLVKNYYKVGYKLMVIVVWKGNMKITLMLGEKNKTLKYFLVLNFLSL